MKIFAEIPYNEHESVRLIWPDSCWLRSDRPLYIPDFADKFAALPMAAYKAGRLGKNISPRFSRRYLTEHSVALALFPSKCLSDIKRGVTPEMSNICFDNALVLGNWTKESFESAECRIYHPSGNVSEENIREFKMPEETYIAETLASFSKYNTIKMGDILLYPISDSEIQLSENIQVTISSPVSDKPLLNTRFK